MAVFGPGKPRKIPVPKRHGVRDPLKRKAELEAAIKDKINNPPKERDVQEVSNRFKRFVKLKEQANNPAAAAAQKRKQQQKRKRDSKRSALQVGDSVVHQLPKEPEVAFLERVTKVQQDRVLEAKFSTKYNVEVERDDSTGAIKLKKKKSHEIDELLKKKAEEAKGGFKRKKKPAREVQKKLTLSEKKALKKQKLAEKQRKEEDKLLEEFQLDKVEFGEVVHGPPTLNTKPRHADKLDGAPRPGKKRLLLHTMLEQSKEEDEQDEEQPRKKKTKKGAAAEKKVDLKGKRKNLPVATRMKLDREQQSVIDMYRQIKKQGRKAE
uniref:Putative m-type 9 protein n=1 Tax=Culex tarsalis TaxID=7177 RepID=A0A1Q3EYN8_CULTA